VLVPVKALDGFEVVLSSLEKVLLRPERISCLMLPAARSDAAGNRTRYVVEF
jgi:hypothetical protein